MSAFNFISALTELRLYSQGDELCIYLENGEHVLNRSAIKTNVYTVAAGVGLYKPILRYI